MMLLYYSLSHCSANWKADVRSLVKDFAQEERARGAKPTAPRLCNYTIIKLYTIIYIYIYIYIS